MYKEKAKFFDGQIAAPWANNDYTVEELKKAEKIISKCKIKKGCRVIEPGCGTGRLTALIAEKCGSAGEIAAFDISQEMVKKAGERLSRYKNVNVSCALLEELSFESAAYDVVLCHQVFPHFEDKFLAVEILSKALKPGGIFAITHLVGIEEINDVHRKSNSPVEKDIMPSNSEIKDILNKYNLEIIELEDTPNCYNVYAVKQ